MGAHLNRVACRQHGADDALDHCPEDEAKHIEETDDGVLHWVGRRNVEAASEHDNRLVDAAHVRGVDIVAWWDLAAELEATDPVLLLRLEGEAHIVEHGKDLNFARRRAHAPTCIGLRVQVVLKAAKVVTGAASHAALAIDIGEHALEQRLDDAPIVSRRPLKDADQTPRARAPMDDDRNRDHPLHGGP